MYPRQSFITIDENYLRDADALAAILDRCCREGLQLMVPEGAFFVFSRTVKPLITWKHSLSPLAAFRELVVVSRKFGTMISEERKTAIPCSSLVDEPVTTGVRALLAELERADDSSIRKIVETRLPALLPASLSVWDQHSTHKAYLLHMRARLKEGLSADQLRFLRQARDVGLRLWMIANSGNFVYDGLRHFGCDRSTAFHLTRTPSINAGFLTASAGLAVYWLVFSGSDSLPVKQFTNDILDWEYIALGALTRGLATEDNRAKRIYAAVEAGFEGRQGYVPRAESSSLTA